MKPLNECSARVAATVLESDKDECNEERMEKDSGSFAGKENVPERNEAMVLPIRGLGHRRG